MGNLVLQTNIYSCISRSTGWVSVLPPHAHIFIIFPWNIYKGLQSFKHSSFYEASCLSLSNQKSKESENQHLSPRVRVLFLKLLKISSLRSGKASSANLNQYHLLEKKNVVFLSKILSCIWKIAPIRVFFSSLEFLCSE